jgi:hypothetical protein
VIKVQKESTPHALGKTDEGRTMHIRFTVRQLVRLIRVVSATDGVHFAYLCTGMKRFEFHLDISAQRYLSDYRGAVRQVVVQCKDGSSVQFPASFLTQFVAVNGTHGDFVLT